MFYYTRCLQTLDYTWLHSLWFRGGTQYVYQMLWENQANILHIDGMIDNVYDLFEKLVYLLMKLY